MNVRELQQFIRSLHAPLAAAGAPRKITDDLERIVAGLEPFRDRPLAEFADFLVRAEEYHRTGVVSGRRRQRQPVDQNKVLEAAQNFKGLCERALDPDVSSESIEGELNRIVEPLNDAELRQVVQEVGGQAVRTRKSALAELNRLLREGRRPAETPAETRAEMPSEETAPVG
ncbi:MAG: hypothetical protein NZM31_15355 [Gemmatales bacterium]|nr:hypothetical protein [Gemmatales bacterium]MDW8388373.1 hypothetical protein [Gemmatales bacterium]